MYEVLVGEELDLDSVDLGVILDLFAGLVSGDKSFAPGIQSIINSIGISGAKYFRIPLPEDSPETLELFNTQFGVDYFTGGIIKVDEDLPLSLVAAVFAKTAANIDEANAWGEFDPTNLVGFGMRLVSATLEDMMRGDYPIEFYGEINGEPILITQEPVMLKFVEAPYYEIKFDSRGGSYVESINGDYGVPISEPTPPTREGYSFKGWYDEALENEYVFNIMPKANITLYAKWEINSYQVIFKNDKGEQIGETQTVTHGSKVSAPVAPDVPDGYVGDWYQLAEGNATPYDFDAPITEAMEIAFVINVTVEKAFELIQGELDKAPTMLGKNKQMGLNMQILLLMR